MTLNNQIQDLAYTQIRFDEATATSFPHVTAAMGEVEEAELEQIVEALADLVGQTSATPVRFGAPYRESTTGRYVIAEVFLPQELEDLRRTIRSRTEGLFREAARTSVGAHVTIAHVEAEFAAVDSLLTDEPPLPSCSLDRIDIALGGAKGCRKNVLRTFRLDRS